MTTPTKSTLQQMPAGVWVLGFVSMLMDISLEMIHRLLPLFMVTTLGASALAVGLVEGLAESTALIVKVFSGALSDYLGKRKGLAVFGYAMGALTKPLFAIAPTVSVVLSARLLDRVGKGIRGAPRDAMVADIAPAHLRGAAFGLRQSIDTVGAFLGPLLAVGLMLLWANDFRAVFWVAVIPGLMAVALLQLGHGLFRILELRVLDTAQAGGTALSMITGNLDLPGKTEHVRCQRRLQQLVYFHASGCCMGLRLLQQAGQVAQHLAKNGDRGVVGRVEKDMIITPCFTSRGTTQRPDFVPAAV